jgi:dihydropteroate synthase
MGIINTTPDSFFQGSRQQTVNAALQQAEKMITEGATILDIGGQSTRPGSEKINAERRLQRVLPIIAAVHKAFPNQLFPLILTMHPL